MAACGGNRAWHITVCMRMECHGQGISHSCPHLGSTQRVVADCGTVHYHSTQDPLNSALAFSDWSGMIDGNDNGERINERPWQDHYKHARTRVHDDAIDASVGEGRAGCNSVDSLHTRMQAYTIWSAS